MRRSGKAGRGQSEGDVVYETVLVERPCPRRGWIEQVRAVCETKQFLYANVVEQDIALEAQRGGEALARRDGTPEMREAVLSFREKRRPVFR